jgi:hypothetical protein
MNLPIIVLESLVAGFAFGAGRALGDWSVEKVRERTLRCSNCGQSREEHLVQCPKDDKP